MHRRPQFEPLARLAAAGCGLSGPWGPRWVGLSCRTRTPGPLVSRRCVCPAWCSCGGCAAGARLGWLCRWGLGWVRGLSLALARLSCRVQLRRLCRRCALGLAVPLGFGWVHGLRLALARLSCRVQLPRFAAGAFLVCFAAIPAGSIAYVGEALSVGIPWLR